MISSGPSDASNPDRCLERLASLSRVGVRAGRVLRSELYHRVSAAVRVARGGPEVEASERVGIEEGTALRLWLVGENGYRFAATTGSGRANVDQLVRRAHDGPGPIAAREEARPPTGPPRLDHDEASGLPSVEELTGRLEDGLAIFRNSRRAGEVTEPDQAWIEAASTVETWAVDGVPLASRTRRRGWALLRPAPSDGSSGSPRPALIASRSWDQLALDRWSEARGRTARPGEATPGAANSRISLIFDPETSATLALALVRSVHTGPGPTGLQAGPGWRVWNCPNARNAIFGGNFDDAAVGTAKAVLADGRRLVGRIDGDGHLRRPSFRDLPRPLPSHLIVDPPDRVEAPEALRVEAISIHPLPTGQWVLDLGGAYVTTTPAEILNCCIAGVGEDRSSHRGVVTPALLFEGLEVRT